VSISVSIRLVAVSVVVAGVLGCRDATSPEDARARAALTHVQRNVFGGSGKVLGRTGGKRKAEVVKQTIPPQGGVLKLPQSGLTLRFPAGAVTKPLTITVTALAGDLVAYDFQPHGTVFKTPVLVQQDLKGTKAEIDPSLMTQLRGGFLANGEKDIDASGKAQITETYAIQLFTEGGPKPRQARFTITHFSGYILASGVICSHLIPVLPITLEGP
jgi:hypothetical protein